ncbi:MAG TPA: leucyl/phenylalanyl-tRNA--protein transferase [Phycisphaerae bacterium]|nr:leucyl/phenylalanyl-tRNA--protein transferase [Phycisphaerae bacterium]HRR87426.1 leucyl/phenylalanyl-tRNA--protein transferase [Phycisphaerae bacterium]
MKTLPLTPQVLVAAYASGIFPMDVEGRIQWFSPDPRAVIPLDGFHASKTCMQTWRSGRFEIRVNTAFEEVMRGCADRREGTWISEQIVEAYCRLHELGLAHSVESWRAIDQPAGSSQGSAGELAGGLYGVAIGGAFFGESMFSRQRDASKVALVALVERMRSRGFALLDVQFLTPHLQRFGAVEIPRREYLERLKDALKIRASFVD